MSGGDECSGVGHSTFGSENGGECEGGIGGSSAGAGEGALTGFSFGKFEGICGGSVVPGCAASPVFGELWEDAVEAAGFIDDEELIEFDGGFFAATESEPEVARHSAGECFVAHFGAGESDHATDVVFDVFGGVFGRFLFCGFGSSLGGGFFGGVFFGESLEFGEIERGGELGGVRFAIELSEDESGDASEYGGADGVEEYGTAASGERFFGGAALSFGFVRESSGAAFGFLFGGVGGDEDRDHAFGICAAHAFADGGFGDEVGLFAHRTDGFLESSFFGFE
ncbi:MAG: hypothetical protein ACKO2L_06140 [Planctomycetaceae bacterium]